MCEFDDGTGYCILKDALCDDVTTSICEHYTPAMQKYDYDHFIGGGAVEGDDFLDVLRKI